MKHLAGLAGLAAAFKYPEYCSKVNDAFASARTIPKLTVEARELDPTLLHVSAIIRHGARTPAGRYRCWREYEPAWDCGLVEVFKPRSTDHPSHADVPPFRKVYDLIPELNVLGGTCGKGHLLEEGYLQHSVMGRLFAEYYQHQNEPLIKPGQDPRAEIWFRSSDMQRTLLSGATFLSSFLQTGGLNTDGTITVHTMDEENDFIFPNTHMCPKLQSVKEALLSSNTFLEIESKYADTRKRISKTIGVDDMKTSWPGEFFDCLLTAVCADQWLSLPQELRPVFNSTDDRAGEKEIDEAGDENGGQRTTTTPPPPTFFDEILSATVEAVNEYADFQYSFNENEYSKKAGIQFLVEFKTEIARVIINDVGEKYPPAQAAKLLASVIPSADLQEFYERIISSGRDSDVKAFDSKRLALYAAHDTTILPFLGSLGGESLFGSVWPPYASEVVFEVYWTGDKYLFRVIYNGSVVTDRLKGCRKTGSKTSNDLCDLAVFFASTRWATPSKVLEACGAAKFPADVVY